MDDRTTVCGCVGTFVNFQRAVHRHEDEIARQIPKTELVAMNTVF